MPSFYAIDTMAVIYRSHFAMIRAPLVNSRGINVSGLLGLLQTLTGILEKRAPDYLAVVSDGPEPTFRHARFPTYKATREKMPEELVNQLPYIPRIVEALKLPYLLVPGYEADDIIGTLVDQARARGLETFMVTGDKDYMQLVDGRTVMYAAKGDETLLTGPDGVAEKFGCTPAGVIEVLALMGDSSDNVPGVRGVGPKTATKLIRQYGTLENLYAHLDEVKGEKLRRTLAAERDSAFLSRELVTIHRNVPLGVSFESLAVHPSVLAQNPALIALLTELEFQSLRDRLLKKAGEPGAMAGAMAAPAAPLDDVRYVTLDTIEALRAELPRLQAAPFLVFDTETTGLDVMRDRIVGLSFSIRAKEACYVPLNAPALAGRRAEVVALLRPLLEAPAPPKGGHNCKYDLH
ncbi:MAG: DNA polymerase I, partial [Candidatus Lambdaproteobacteria bacterium]|nr:DNA polymerase I [Candidatus Lambdaproteobacteria bacterium]